MMNRKERIIYQSGLIGEKLSLTLLNKEFNYGPGIGRADNYCVIKDWIVVFEMEFSQRHPEMNVMKVWPYLEANPEKKIFLVQHLIDEKSVSPNRIKLCHWMANKIKEQLKDRFNYTLIINDCSEGSLTSIKDHLTTLEII